MNIRRFRLCIFGLTAVLAALMLCGCEDNDPDTDKLTSYFDENPYESISQPDISDVTLIVVPSSKTLLYDAALATFQASGGEPPYSWLVIDVEVGSIIRESGGENDAVVYQRDGVGDNVVVLRDSGNQEVYAFIQQPVEEEEE